MIPAQNIVAWGNIVPWAEQRQVEQDLIISRAIVAIYADEQLRNQLRFRGGTALNKLHFVPALRYSEDIDLVRTEAGPIGPVLDRLRAVLQPWLGQAQFVPSIVAPKLRFRIDAEDGGAQIRLKVEINTSEINAYDPELRMPFAVDNPWFAGNAEVATFSREEILATKLRALLQRDKGRDLYDLAHSLDLFNGLNEERVAVLFGQYLQAAGQAITRAQAQQRMFAKLANPNFVVDMRPLLPAAQAVQLTEESTRGQFREVFTRFIDRLPGDPWARTAEMKERFDLQW